MTDASGLTHGKDFNVLSYKTWKVSDIATKAQPDPGRPWMGRPAGLLGSGAI